MEPKTNDMKQTAEEFLKEKAQYLHDPKGIHHFTGDFVIEMMEGYTDRLAEQEGEKVEWVKNLLEDFFIWNHYHRGELTIDAEPHHFVQKFIEDEKPTLLNPPQPTTLSEGRMHKMNPFSLEWVSHHNAWEDGFKAALSELNQAKREGEITGEHKCQCGDESTGNTTICCCNLCGFPLPTEPWHFILPQPTTLSEQEGFLINEKNIRDAFDKHSVWIESHSEDFMTFTGYKLAIIALSELNQLKSDGWVSVEDRLPEHKELVWISHLYNGIMAVEEDTYNSVKKKWELTIEDVLFWKEQEIAPEPPNSLTTKPE